jgi:hypothetical protein
MARWLEHPESRRLLRDAAWVVVLLGLLWSPLPEMVLGRWLQVGNDARPETGRAHDRLDLLQESDSQAVSQSSELEKQAEEVAKVTSLGLLRVHLIRHGEVELPLSRFRSIYTGLDVAQQDQILPADELEALVQRGLSAVMAQRHGPNARLAFLDKSRNRMDGVEVNLLQVQLLPLGLAQVARQDTSATLDGDDVVRVEDREAEDLLPAADRELLERLRQLPGLSVRRLWRSAEGLLLVEVRAGETLWLRPGAGGGSGGETTKDGTVQP